MKVVVSSAGAGAGNALPVVVDGGVLVGVDGVWVGSDSGDIQVNSIEAAGQAASGNVATGALSAESGDLARATDILPESATVADADAYEGVGGATGHDATGFYSVKGAETKRVEHDAMAALEGTSGTPGSGNKYVTDQDSRLNDTRAPTNHASDHVTGGSDVIADVVASGNSGLMSGTDKAKLDGIASGAEVNVNADWDAVSGDSLILNKPATLPPSAHDQAASTIIASTTNFDGVLTASEDTIQKALDALDDHTHAGGGQSIFYGAQANRPAAGTEGHLYMPTDGYFPAIDNGSSWDVYVDGFKCSNPPAYSSFTKVGSDAGDTLIADGDGLLMTSIGNNSTSMSNALWLLSLIAAPYTFCVGFDVQFLYPASSMAVGIVLADGTATNSKHITFELVAQNNAFDIPLIASEKFSALNAYADVYSPTFYLGLYCRIWLRIRDDNTNRYHEFSQDGRNWQRLHSVSRTDYLTPTHCGLKSAQTGTAVPTTMNAVQAKIFHWSLGSGA